jgi:hypothetical protein
MQIMQRMQRDPVSLARGVGWLLNRNARPWPRWRA